MHLNAYVADARKAIFEDLQKGHPPSCGEFSVATFRDGRAKGKPQMGATTYSQDAVHLEFIYPDATASATILSVRVPTPERIVFMPVPAWVIEQIWQGEISGSYQFESEADEMLAELKRTLEPQLNSKFFP